MYRRQVGAAAEISEGEGNDSGQSQVFSTSFPKRAQKIWLSLMAPYSKSDDSDFIEDGEDDVDGNSMSIRPIFEKPECVENTLIEHLKQRRMASQGPRHGYDSSSSDSSSGSCSDSSDHKELSEEDSVLSILHVSGDDADDEEHLAEEIVSSEDEWMKNKRKKKNRGKRSGSVKKRSRIQRKGLKESDGDDEDEDDFVDLATDETVPSKNSKSNNPSRSSKDVLCSSSDDEVDEKEQGESPEMSSVQRRINRIQSKKVKKVTIIDSSSDDE